MILFLVNTFPSRERTKDGAFNLRAAKQLASQNNLKTFHLRAWHPRRKIIDSYEIEGLDVTVFSFPLFPKAPSKIAGIQLFIYKKMFFLLNKKKLNNSKLVHSVGASFSGIVGSHIAKELKIKHIAQCIGSDINFRIPVLQNYFGIKEWDKYVDYFGCNSNELSVAVKKLYSEAKTKVIYRGVDLEEFTFNLSKFENVNEKVYFLFLGGLSYRGETPHGSNLKGGKTLLKAWKVFIDTHPEIINKVELLFGGPGISQETITKVIETNDFKLYSLNIVGQINKQEVKKHMLKSHVVIVPSMAEGLPNIAMEAAASGNAIIASDVGGTHEVVKNGYNGKLVEAGNIAQLSEAIKAMVEEKSHIENIGKNSRKLMEENFDKNQFGKGYQRLYSILLNKNQN